MSVVNIGKHTQKRKHDRFQNRFSELVFSFSWPLGFRFGPFWSEKRILRNKSCRGVIFHVFNRESRSKHVKIVFYMFFLNPIMGSIVVRFLWFFNMFLSIFLFAWAVRRSWLFWEGPGGYQDSSPPNFFRIRLHRAEWCPKGQRKTTVKQLAMRRKSIFWGRFILFFPPGSGNLRFSRW